MERIYDVVELVSTRAKERLMHVLSDVSASEMKTYAMLKELDFTKSKTYCDLCEGKNGMSKKVLAARLIDLYDGYAKGYPYDAFMQKSELDDICKERNYTFDKLSSYRGSVNDAVLSHCIKKRDNLLEKDAIFYVENTENNTSGYFSMEEINDNGYNENKFKKRKTTLLILAPKELMESAQWYGKLPAGATGCSIFVHVLNGYLQICCF